jgi:glycerol-3-phosphate dehydrogenase (NAD(P)+)
MPTTLWARRPELADAIAVERVNPDYLPDERLPPELDATSDLELAARGADLVLLAVPSHGFRTVVEQLARFVPGGAAVVSLTKGLERHSLLRMTEIVAELLPGRPAGVLSGPNLALEVIRGYAAAAVVAMPDLELASSIQRRLRTQRLRLYTSTDVTGAELGGALKNVFAIAAGMAQGLGAGDNTRATVIARGLREMTCLGVAAGGQPETFAGLAGIGDLLATCMSAHSRNRSVGEQLALGRSLEEIQRELRTVAEGVRTAPAVMELVGRVGIELPIAREVDAVVRGERTPAEAFRGLLRSAPSTELVPG